MSQDKRQHPRYVRRLRVDVLGLEIYTTNVSLGGVQVECPAMRFTGLKTAIADDQLEIRMWLPGEPLPLILTTAIRYADPVEDSYLIGLQFTGFGNYARERWQSYVEALASVGLLKK